MGNTLVEEAVPELIGWDYEVTSEQNFEYNCIAWAASDNTQWWWPTDNGCAYWPPGVPIELTVAAFVRAYESIGYRRCASDEFEAGYEKIALFADAAGEPTHACRQLDSVWWTSKLGSWHDIRHPLYALKGSQYGDVAVVMKRPAAIPSRTDTNLAVPAKKNRVGQATEDGGACTGCAQIQSARRMGQKQCAKCGKWWHATIERKCKCEPGMGLIVRKDDGDYWTCPVCDVEWPAIIVKGKAKRA